jgi:beta-lactam-binding protein with PASTA domain/tRNA A-37 threonylcarbamoyl transferase component Bud32
VTGVDQSPLLGGRYELRELIGTGGMADVRRGFDVRLGREVAVKVLRRDLARDPSFQARFRREAQAAASLNAASIVSVYDTGEDAQGLPYIVMEYLPGRTLRAVLHEQGRLAPEHALAVTADICAALDVAHAAGIVHRDIKPANVMLTPAGEVKVMDFGIARAAADTSAMTQTAAIIGTAAYLSPEQARGEHVDGRSDLYSTGCLLYELLTGVPPFSGDSPVAVAYQHVREEPRPPSVYDATLAPQVDAVVLKAMAKNPAHRYASAQEMRDDLLRARAGEQVAASAGSTTQSEPAPPTDGAQERHPKGTSLLGWAVFGLLLLAVAAASAMAVRGQSSPAAPPPVRAPDVVGLDQRRAVAVLAEAGLALDGLEPVFDSREPGTVISQTPPHGAIVPEDGKVALVVSRGVETTVVPVEAVGRSREEAEVLLADRGLEVAKPVLRDGLHLPDTVLALTPEPGRRVPTGTSVTMTVASGRVPVPDVRGQQRGPAVSTLQEAGFSARVQLEYGDRPAEQVLEQSPVGELAVVGSTVEVVVSQPVPSSAPVTDEDDDAEDDEPSAAPSPDPSPNDVAPPGETG